jgi:hypothetical protein
MDSTSVNSNYLSSSPCRRRQVRRHGYHRHRGLACRRPWRLLPHASTSPLATPPVPLYLAAETMWACLAVGFLPPAGGMRDSRTCVRTPMAVPPGRPVVGRRNRGEETIYRRGDAGEGASTTPTRATDRRKWSSERAQQRRVARGSGRHGEVK